MVNILTPCGDEVKTQYAMSLVAMTQHTSQARPRGLAGVAVKALGVSILPKGRQTLIDSALEGDATHVMWIDSDMAFPADTLIRLMNHDKPIVGVNYMARRPPYMMTTQDVEGQQVATNNESQGLQRVGRMGFGLLWIDLRVFAQMKRPFFPFDYDYATNSFTGEDYAFFAQTEALGFESFVDHDLSKEVLHIGNFGYSPLLSGMLGDA